MTFTLTEEQINAVDTLDVNCIVTAGAGSGKTRVLVERYLKIIEEKSITNSNIFEEIVAITFTEKAAKEMKERVRQSMIEKKERALENNEREQAVIWRDNIQKLERATISTIHSFCAKILREYPIEADLDPEFVVMESTESTWILTDVVKKELKNYIKNEKELDSLHLYHWVKEIGFKRVVTEIIKLYHQLGNSGLDMYEIAKLTTDSFALSPYLLLIDLELIDWIKLFSLGDNLNNCESTSGKKLKLYQESWPSIKQQIFANKTNGDGLEEVISTLVDITKGNFGAKTSDARKAINDLAKEYLDLIIATKYQYTEEELVSSLIILLEKINLSFVEEKAKNNALDFDDLQLRVIKLLQDNLDIRVKIHDNISYLMLDEFQDSNQIQKKLVSLVLEDENKFIKPGSLFVVGDPKQSIYRFRGADVNVFKDMQLEISTTSGRVCPLNNNFRSTHTIINFINYFFSQIMSTQPDSPNYYENAIPGKEAELEEKVEFIPIYHEKNDETSVRDKEAVSIAKRIEELIRSGVEPKEIAILFRSMSNVKNYEQELLKIDIPFYVVGGRGFYQKQEIFDLLNILEYLLDSSNKIALTGILRSSLVAISDDTLYQIIKSETINQPISCWKDNLIDISELEKAKIIYFIDWIEKIKAISGRTKVTELLDTFVELTNYEAILLAQQNGVQAVANVEKFIRLVKEYTEENPYSIFNFLQIVNRLISEEQQETEAAVEAETGDTVKIMTIHKSKGLQFSYVFIPEISREPKNDDSLLKFDPKLGLSCRVVNDKSEIVKPMRWIVIADKEKKLDREESVRILYVAMTRAIKKLFLSGKVEDTKGRFSKSEVLLANTWSKWFDIIMQYESISLEKKSWQYQQNDNLVGEINIFQSHMVIDENIQNFASGNNILEVIDANRNLINQEHDIIDFTKRIRKKSKECEHSISAIKRYIKCPRYYYYIDRLSLYDLTNWFHIEDISDYEDDTHSETKNVSPMLKGTIVHQLLEEITKKPEKICKWDLVLDAILIDNGIINNKYSDNDITKFEREVKDMISNFKQSPYFSEIYCDNVKTEYDFTLQLNNGKISGIIDRLEFNSDGTFTIIDYKTDKFIETEEYIPQITTYALAMKKSLNQKSTNGFLYFLRHNRIEEIGINEDILLEWENFLEELLIKINQSITINHFEQNRDKCAKCFFNTICSNC